MVTRQHLHMADPLSLRPHPALQVSPRLAEYQAYESTRGAAVPLEFEGAVDAALLKKSQDYLIDQTKLSAAESAFMSLAVIIFFFGGFA